MNKISNISEYTVSQLNKSIKNIIEGKFNVIKVVGMVIIKLLRKNLAIGLLIKTSE